MSNAWDRGRVTTLLVSDLTEGGAAIAARRLYRALSVDDVRTGWLAARGDPRSGAVIAEDWIDLRGLLLYRAANRITRKPGTVKKARRRLYERTLLGGIRNLGPNLINVHNIHAVATFGLMEALPRSVPLVWTLHDMWALTGGCIYPGACTKWASGGCGLVCGQDVVLAGTDLPPGREWRRRREFLRRNSSRTILVTPSQWLASNVRAACGDTADVVCIPNSVDPCVFRPVPERQAVRRWLGLPASGPIVLTGSHFVTDPRKGAAVLAEAVSRLRRVGRVCTVIALGERHPGDANTDGWTFTGLVRDEALLNLYYNAADVHVLPSRADNLPNTLLESMAAGTPSVASDVGGCGEAVREGETGSLVAPGDPAHLAERLGYHFDMSPAERDHLRDRCRHAAERDYTPQVQAQRYREVFEKLRPAAA